MFLNKNSHQPWPEDVGIVAMEVYFPSYYVDQTELEQFVGVSGGKYTIGLGQMKMGFCSDLEDINSLCLTVVHKLMKRTGLSYESIGRLEVGTETIIDKSKSAKSVLMQLFESSGNSDVEGVDNTNACYGGTAALLNSVAWVESSAWDGRYALVVAGDIAVYATGNARPTGGAGAVAMLIGAHAPLVFERGLRGSHMAHVYDFYKPDLMSEYPTVFGKLSLMCYAKALDKCYSFYCQKAEKVLTKKNFSLEEIDAMVFHAPFCKMVQKSLARLFFVDFLRNANSELAKKCTGLDKFRKMNIEETYSDRDLEKLLVDASKETFLSKTKPSLLVATNVGNQYTASLYSCLASYISNKPLNELAGKRVGLFSYGGGLAATFFSIKVTSDCSTGSPLDKLHKSLVNLPSRLNSRIKVSPSDYDAILKLREETLHLAPYKPVGKEEDLFPDTFYLVSIDDMHRRQYSCAKSKGEANDVHVNCQKNGMLC